MNRKIGTALVVGAGISGIRAALDLAEIGYGVTLIDRSHHLGGVLSQLDYQFPTDGCGMCRMLPTVERDASSQFCLRKGFFHKNLEILLSTELTALEGEPGNFRATLKQETNPVNPDLCSGCGECVSVCPVSVPDRFNAGLGDRKAVYRPVPHTAPGAFRIDTDACTLCGACEKACPEGAVSLSDPLRQQFRILVVDDELVVRDSLKEWLLEEGFSVSTAASGAEALEILGKEPRHLMLTDIKMPGMDGVELLQRARDLYPDLTVIMMTAYATVETAVEAIKIGARDYLVKPFDPETLVPMVVGIFGEAMGSGTRTLEVGALLLCGGTDAFDPLTGKDPLAYGSSPDVLTGLEFERLLSGTGPTGGKLLRPSDGKPVRSIAWIQCVGSRDLSMDADFCSGFCCMASIKEALAARERSPGKIPLTIFYMDMRTYGKGYEAYREHAEKEGGIEFRWGRVHTVVKSEKDGKLRLRYVDGAGAVRDLERDLVVLATGRRPAKGLAELAELTGIELNRWGFASTEPFSLSRAGKAGIYIGGGFSGPKDIADSVIQASSSALQASRLIHGQGGGLWRVPDFDASEAEPFGSVSGLEKGPRVESVTGSGNSASNERGVSQLDGGEGDGSASGAGFNGSMGTDPGSVQSVSVLQKALVVGGGIAGMTASLAIADHGFGVDLVERSEKLGGNLQWLIRTLEGFEVRPFLEETVSRVETHPLIRVHANTSVAASTGEVGLFLTTVEGSDGRVETIEHGTVLLATGGKEAPTTSYGHGTSDSVVTLRELEIKLEDGSVKPGELSSVVIILCVDSREEKRNYCSRVCCASALKHALHLKAENPDIMVTVLYRDIMTHGFSESYYTDARRNDILFVRYKKEQKPRVRLDEGKAKVIVEEPILGRMMEVEADLLVLAVGIVPTLPRTMGEAFGGTVNERNLGCTLTDGRLGGITDENGFFKEADSKWRPVDSLREGVFACGLAHSPRSIPEAVASAEAAAVRSLRILARAELRSAGVVAMVRNTLCSRCGLCIDACPYGARRMTHDPDQLRVNPIMCQGCGACVSLCPNGASVLSGYPKNRMLDLIDAVLKGEPI